jgi:hypothetical protein
MMKKSLGGLGLLLPSIVRMVSSHLSFRFIEVVPLIGGAQVRA